MRFEDQRKIMVNRQIVERGITDPEIVNAFIKVERHLFVPESVRQFSYEDHPVSIGANQTISQPYIVALMIKLLNINKEDKVLEIGTGSGYQTAILAELAHEVCTVERIDALLQQAKGVLRKLKYRNIHFSISDGTMGWTKPYPKIDKFNKIIVSAASPKIPDSLTNQLEENGKLIIPVGSKFSQDLILVTKQENELITKNFGGCTFVPLIGKDGW